MKDGGEAIRPFRYNLNQIPYGLYSGSDKESQGIRSDRQRAFKPWMEVCNTVQEALIKTIPPKRENQKGKMVV